MGLVRSIFHFTSSLLISEWNAILRAKGYGKSWFHWALGFEALPFIPVSVPDIPFVDVAIAISKIDCDFACQEISQRRKSFKYKIQIDQSQDFNQLSYSLMRGAGPSLPPCKKFQLLIVAMPLFADRSKGVLS